MPHCIALGCNNNQSRNPLKKHFFTFPNYKLDSNEIRRAEIWLSNVGTGFTTKTFKPTKSKKVCSDHFHKCCIEEDKAAKLLGMKPRNVRLKEGAIPTLFEHKTYEIININGEKALGTYHGTRSLTMLKQSEEKEQNEVLPTFIVDLSYQQPPPTTETTNELRPPEVISSTQNVLHEPCYSSYDNGSSTPTSDDSKYDNKAAFEETSDVYYRLVTSFTWERVEKIDEQFPHLTTCIKGLTRIPDSKYNVLDEVNTITSNSYVESDSTMYYKFVSSGTWELVEAMETQFADIMDTILTPTYKAGRNYTDKRESFPSSSSAIFADVDVSKNLIPVLEKYMRQKDSLPSSSSSTVVQILDDDAFKCELCDRQFSKINGLNSHKRHHPACVKCGQLLQFSFSIGGSSWERKRKFRCDGSGSIFPCEICYKEFTCDSMLLSHMKYIHKNVHFLNKKLLIKCHECHMYHKYHDIGRHMKSHADELCSCGQCFTRLRKVSMNNTSYKEKNCIVVRNHIND